MTYDYTPQLLHATSVMQVALKYTEAQEQDLLHLRRLFYGKLGQLARERAALLSKMPAVCSVTEGESVSFHLGYRHVTDQLALTKEVSDQLCANHAEESSVYMTHGFCLFRCVSLFAMDTSISCFAGRQWVLPVLLHTSVIYLTTTVISLQLDC